MGKAWLSKLTTALVSISFLLQIASIALPGWTVYIEGNTDEQHGLFYRRTCKSLLDITDCKVESFHDIHSDMRDRFVDAGVSREKIASVDLKYNMLVSQQVLMVIAVCLTLVVVVSQIIQVRRPQTLNVRLILLSAISAATSAGMVITIVCIEIVKIIHQIEIHGMDGHRDHTYVGFPYCLAMLIGSVILHFFAEISISSQLHTPEIRIMSKRKLSEDNISVTPVTPEKPLSIVYEVSKPTKYDSHGKDNPVFSEKL